MDLLTLPLDGGKTAHLDLFCVSVFKILLHDGIDRFFQFLLIDLWHDCFINCVPLCKQ